MGNEGISQVTTVDGHNWRCAEAISRLDYIKELASIYAADARVSGVSASTKLSWRNLVSEIENIKVFINEICAQGGR